MKKFFMLHVTIWHNFYINYINILYSVTDIQKLKNPIK